MTSIPHTAEREALRELTFSMRHSAGQWMVPGWDGHKIADLLERVAAALEPVGEGSAPAVEPVAVMEAAEFIAHEFGAPLDSPETKAAHVAAIIALASPASPAEQAATQAEAKKEELARRLLNVAAQIEEAIRDRDHLRFPTKTANAMREAAAILAAPAAQAEPDLWKVIGELREAAREALAHDPAVGIFADHERAATLNEWADRLETTQAAFYEDVYEQCAEAIRPLVDAGKLPGSVVESVQAMVAEQAAPKAELLTREAAKKMVARFGNAAIALDKGEGTISGFVQLSNELIDAIATPSTDSGRATPKPDSALPLVADTLTEDEWLDLAERHASKDWNSDGYLNAVKAVCQDFVRTASPARAIPEQSEHLAKGTQGADLTDSQIDEALEAWFASGPVGADQKTDRTRMRAAIDAAQGKP
jgi:hypothetical protein